MKKIEILCVGKIKEAYYVEAIAEYAKRLSRFCEFSITEVLDAPDSPSAVRLESQKLLEKMNGFVILLDLKGESVTSAQFSKTIDTAFVSASRVQVVIGGSRGVSDAVRAKANAVYNFGKVTYPHQLMRVIATEQIYRAMSIGNGCPYHK